MPQSPVSSLQSPNSRHVHLFFMDGVGLGGPDPASNPFVTAVLPNLTNLLGEDWYLAVIGQVATLAAEPMPIATGRTSTAESRKATRSRVSDSHSWSVL